jgi:hypothetical protein
MSQTQLEKLLKELKQIKPNVTKGDRVTYRNTHTKFRKPSDNTILNYLNGKGSNADIAYDLLSFFKHQISKRNEIL